MRRALTIWFAFNRPRPADQHTQAEQQVARRRAEVILPLRAIQQGRYGAGFDERLPDLRARLTAIEIDAERAQLEALSYGSGERMKASEVRALDEVLSRRSANGER